jgi:hypothetical protein
MTPSSTSPADNPRPRGRQLSLEKTIENSYMTKYIANGVRHATKDFTSKHLSLAERHKLNSIILNAIYTALDAFKRSEKSKAANAWAYDLWNSIPAYWDDPKLLEDYKESLRMYVPSRRGKKSAEA